MRKLLFLFFFLQLLLNITKAQTYRLKEFDSLLSLLHHTNRFNGTVLYAENGKVKYKKAFGVADFRTNSPLSTTSSFNLASVTKQFICMAIMILKEEGELQFDDDCSLYLTGFPYNNITIRNLMTHTSGIPEYFDLFQQNRTPLDTLNNEKLLALFTKYKPDIDFPAGTKWAYCNTNYVLLASIIEHVSKQPIELFIKKRITEPLGLKNTYIYHVQMPGVPENHVLGFKVNSDTNEMNDLTYFDGIVGDGNLYSSVEDLYKWEQSLSTEKLIKKTTFAEAVKPVKLKNGNTYPYGFGWFIDNEKEQQYSHTGGWAGFVNYFFRDAKNKRVLIVLSNGTNGSANRISKDFINGKMLSVTPTLLITNVKLIDGTGTPARNASVRIEGKKIISVGNLKPFEGEEVIDGNGKILAPGFIDTHSHLAGYLEKFPEAMAALNQGVTTIVSGQDGESDPVDSIKAFLQKRPVAVNIATYTGQTSLREKIMGATQLYRQATQAEIKGMEQLLSQDLQNGSLGLSTGLEYEGAFYSSRSEVIALAKVAAKYKAKYTSHIRSEDINMDDAIDEIIEIGRQANIPVQISHIKIALKDKWNTSSQLLAVLEKARSQGIDISADCYPYDFWNSTTRVLFPKKNFSSIIGATYAVDHLFDPEKSVMVRFKPDTAYKGKTVAQISTMRNETPAQTLLYLVAAAQLYNQQHPDEGGTETIMGKSMTENDLINFFSWPNTNICSDGGNGGHPRGYGSFTRVLYKYVKEKKVLSWEEAIYKMTGLAASHTGIKNRGIISPGYFADFVLIDPDTVKDNADIQNSTALSDGILKVWVNGKLVYQEKTFLQQYPGEFAGR